MEKFYGYEKEAISGLSAIKETNRENIHIQMERSTTELIRKIGIPANTRGYHYLRSAIVLAIYDPDIIHFVTTKLYVKVAEKHHTTPTRVERAIRFAITCTWNKLYFGEVKSDDWEAEYRPSNSEFIATVADKVKLEYKYMSEPSYAAEEF